jgi:hypothetical protein
VGAGLLVSLALLPAPLRAEEEDYSAAGFSKQRIEQEDKLFVPRAEAEEVWAFLHERFVKDVDYLKSLDPLFTSYFDVELFADTYYDTPTLQLLAMQSGVRKRYRVNITNPADRKSGRELMQIKINDITSNEFQRGEVKFAIEYPTDLEDPIEDTHPLLGPVKRSQRSEFKAHLAKIGLDPMAMRPLFTVHDIRTRIYIKRDGAPFMSVSFDRVSSRLWWADAEFIEIEPELNEIAYTDADPETRRYMESIGAKVSAEIVGRFPSIERNLVPKYNKTFNQFAEQVPLLKALVWAKMTPVP